MQNNRTSKQKTGSRDKIIFIVIIVICLILFFAIRSYVINKEQSDQDNEQSKKEENQQATENKKTIPDEKTKAQREKASNSKNKRQNEKSGKTLPQPATQKSKTIKQQKTNKNNVNPAIKFIKETGGKGKNSSQFKTKKYPDSMNLIWKMCLAEVLGLCKDKQNVLFPILGTPGTSIEENRAKDYRVKGYYLYKNNKTIFSIQLISAGNSIIDIQKIKFINSP